MTEQDEWGPWIEHDGKGCPLPDGIFIGAYSALRSGGERYSEGINPGDNICWHGGGEEGGQYWIAVLRYRIRKPRGLTILESLLADLPEEVTA